MSSSQTLQLEKNHHSLLVQQWMNVMGGALFIVLCAQIRIPLFFSPVPITGQTFAIMLLGGLLGSRQGLSSLLLYVGASMIGLPVLVGGNVFSFNLLTVGYLVGMAFQVYLVGKMSKYTRSYGKLLMGLLATSLIQLTLGTVWMASFVGWQSVLVMGFLPFVPGEILKSIAVATYLGSQKIER